MFVTVTNITVCKTIKHIKQQAVLSPSRERTAAASAAPAFALFRCRVIYLLRRIRSPWKLSIRATCTFPWRGRDAKRLAVSFEAFRG